MNDRTTYSSRERVRRAIRHETADRLPRGELCINDSVILRQLNCQRAGFDEKLSFVNQMGLDIYTLSPVRPDRQNKLPAPGELLWPDIEKWTGQTPLFTFALVDGAFELGMRFHDRLDFLTLYRRSPLSLAEFVSEVESLNIALYREAAEKGIDGIIIADDVAYGKGFLMNPQALREHFFPSLERQVKEIERLGLPAFFHSDGYYREIIPDLIRMGFKGIQCLERSCGMDLWELHGEFGRELCLWGHIATEDTLKAHDPGLLGEMASALGRLSCREGVILGTDCGLFEGTDLSGLKRIYETAC
ncbi:MAG: uroporphyrinogen decarboxylase family protein [Clostridiales bacterium]|jgi:uroporphyrinogen decarboxylase|nr:hypothetical protein [Eubacteriales bacterium]MDH7566451.1 uroporphyrinogen decarboxylase family protein [Clostridiales bacterium]